jgi:hypothetical protein
MASVTTFQVADTVITDSGTRSECEAIVTAVSGSDVTVAYVAGSWKAGEIDTVAPSKLVKKAASKP